MGEIGHGAPVIGRHLHHKQKSFLVPDVGILVGVEEMGLGDEDRLGIKDRGLGGVT